jgi:hypothetical protein
LGSFANYLNQFDPTLVKEPLKLILLLSWLKMEEPASYSVRHEKYLKGIRLLPFSIPIEDDDIKAAFEYSGTLLHEEGLEDKWQAVYLNYVKTRPQEVSA